jgi:hypothetical protein
MEHHHHHQHHDGPTRGVHGMLVLGGQRTDSAMGSSVYVSHLPMFMAPHDFQVIARVTGEAALRLAPFVAHFGTDPIYTFKPEVFAIDELDPAGGGPARTSFRGTLFRGHFERGGSQIADDVSFEVEHVIHFRRFSAPGGNAPRGELRYLCFGERDAAFLAHLISAPPDFDQVLAVELGSVSGLSDEGLRAGAVLAIPGREDNPDARLTEGESLTGAVQAGEAAAGGSIEITVANEYYLETGELAAAM